MARTAAAAATQRREPANAVALQQQAVEKTNSFVADLDAYLPSLADALPQQIPPQRFRRVLITAVSTNPDLLYANRRTLFTAAAKCAADGLLPDGRQAALVVYNTEVKQRDPATGLDTKIRMDVVQYLPMIAGVRDRLHNSGDVLSATAEAVYTNDRFRYSLGDNPFIEHEPAPLGADRGQVIGAYAIIRLANGEVIRDVMDKATIDKARNQGRAPNSLMWADFYWEGAKKTVLKRAAKQAPLSAEMHRMLTRDEEPIDVGSEPVALPAQHQQQRELTPPPRVADQLPPLDDRPEFAIVDLDGEEHTFRSGFRAYDAMRALLPEAAKVGVAQLEGLWETNQPTIEQMAAEFSEQAIDLATEFDRLRQELKAKAASNEAAKSEALSKQDAPTAARTLARGDQLRQEHPERMLQEEADHEAGQPGEEDDQQQAQGSPPASEAATPPKETPAAEQRSSAPAPATAAPEKGESRDSAEIGMVMKKGEPDVRTWTVALFMPKLRRQLTTADLGFFLGDNEENLGTARRKLSAADKQDLENAIAHQWDVAGKQ